MDQVPNQHIVWKSEGQKGHVDGAVTFHELSPDLTRIHLVMEYYPKGLFERTGNLWRAQGRRARLEFKHFVRNASTQTLLHQDEVEGWMGEIRDGKVVEQQQSDNADDKQPTAGTDKTDQSSRNRACHQADASDRDRQNQKAPDHKDSGQPAAHRHGNPANRRREKQSSDKGPSHQLSVGQKGNGSVQRSGAASEARGRTGDRPSGSSQSEPRPKVPCRS